MQSCNVVLLYNSYTTSRGTRQVAENERRVTSSTMRRRQENEHRIVRDRRSTESVLALQWWDALLKRTKISRKQLAWRSRVSS